MLGYKLGTRAVRRWPSSAGKNTVRWKISKTKKYISFSSPKSFRGGSDQQEWVSGEGQKARRLRQQSPSSLTLLHSASSSLDTPAPPRFFRPSPSSIFQVIRRGDGGIFIRERGLERGLGGISIGALDEGRKEGARLRHCCKNWNRN